MAFIHPNHSIEPHVFLGKTFIDPNLKPEPPFDPASLFKNGEQGFWLDPNDLSTMFQDVGGKTTITDVGQTVALVINKVGQSTVSDLTLPSITNWAKSSLVTELTDSSFTVTGGGGIALQAGRLNIGSMHEILIEYVADTVVSFAIYDSAAVNASNFVASSSNGKLTAKYRSQSGGVYLRASGAAKITITKLEVKRISTGDAYQVDSAKQPILRFNSLINKYYLEFDGVDDHLLIDGLTAFRSGTVVGAVEVRSSASSRARAVLSAGVGGYVYITGGSLNAQTTGDSAFIAYPLGSRYFAVDYNELDVTLVNLKQSVIRQVATFPFNNTNQRTLCKFLPTSATSGDLDYYSLLCIDRILSEEERLHIFKKYGAVL